MPRRTGAPEPASSSPESLKIGTPWMTTMRTESRMKRIGHCHVIFPCLLILALAGTVPAAAGAGATMSGSGCERLAGKLYKRTDLGRVVAPTLPPGAEPALTPICFDFTGDRRREVVFAIHGGGSGGAAHWAAFRRTRSKRGPLGRRFRLIAEPRAGQQTMLERRGRLVVVKNPIWRPGDPNAGPSGGELHSLYRIRTNSVKLVRKYHVNQNRR